MVKVSQGLNASEGRKRLILHLLQVLNITGTAQFAMHFLHIQSQGGVIYMQDLQRINPIRPISLRIYARYDFVSFHAILPDCLVGNWYQIAATNKQNNLLPLARLSLMGLNR